MKRIFSVLLCMLIFMSLAYPSFAKDDATVNYVLKISADNEKYSAEETVKITVSVEDIMASAPDIYGLSGNVNYDSYLLELKSVDFISPFTSDVVYNDNKAEGKITFSFLGYPLNGNLIGRAVGAKFDFCTISFVAKKDGTARTYLSDFIITNKDATERLISSDDSGVDVVIGTGETVIDKELLNNAISEAKAELSKANIGATENLVYPAFSVTQEVYDAFSEAIGEAEKALASASKTTEIEFALRALDNAVKVFEASKNYGRKPLVGKDNSDDVIHISVEAVAHSNGKLKKESVKQMVRKGTSASIIAVPDEGFEVEKFVVNGIEYFTDSSIYTIQSVDNATKVEVYFIKKPRFSDVKRGSWYFDAVEKIVEMKLFAGTSETTFSPDAEMTRAMLVTVLHRLEGTPKADAANKFSDVKDGQWYSEAVAWASSNGLVNGYSETLFGTDDSITRQDMVTILYRYLKLKGLTPEGAKAVEGFADANDVSGYALDAIEWAYGTGLVKGTSDTTLSPKTNTTRAQVATIILRYIENVAK